MSCHSAPVTSLGMELSERFEQAAAWAAHIHNDHIRKGTTIPYVSHLFAVASLVLEDGGDEDQAIAALLHDAVEDGRAPLDEVRARFGDEVAGIVAECSDTLDHTRPDAKPPWRQRKDAYIAHMADASDAALRVSNADKLHNARRLLADYRAVGDDLWLRFNRDAQSAEMQLWYYDQLVAAFRKRRGDSELVEELARTVAELRRLATT